MAEVLSRSDLPNEAKLRALAGRARCLLRPVASTSAEGFVFFLFWERLWRWGRKSFFFFFNSCFFVFFGFRNSLDKDF